MEAKEKAPRSAAAWVCGILGLLLQGLVITTLVLHGLEPGSDRMMPWWISLGIASLIMSIVPLSLARAGLVARTLGGVGLLGWAIFGAFIVYAVIAVGRGSGGWHGNQ